MGKQKQKKGVMAEDDYLNMMSQEDEVTNETPVEEENTSKKKDNKKDAKKKNNKKNDTEEVEEEETTVASKKDNKKKDNKKNKKNQQDEEDSEVLELEEETTNKKNNKKDNKKKNNKKGGDDDDYLKSLSGDAESLEEQGNEEPPKKDDKQKKDNKKENKKNNKKGGNDDYMSMIAGNEDEQENKEEEQPKEEKKDNKKKDNKKDNKKKDNKKGGNDDYMSMIAGTEEESEEKEEQPKEEKKDNKKKDNKKKDNKKGGNDDYMSMIAGTEEEMEEKEETKEQKPKKEEKKDNKKDQKKKDEKPKKEEKKKEEKKKDEKKKDDKKAPPKKAVPKALAALKAQLEKQKEEEERLRREEEERRLEEERIQKLLEEEERKKQEEEKALKLKKKQEIDELKKKGLYKTKKQLEEERRAAAMREMMIQSGHIAAFEKKEEKSEIKKVVKKKKKDNKEGTSKQEGEEKSTEQKQQAKETLVFERKEKSDKKKKEEKKHEKREEKVTEQKVEPKVEASVDDWEEFDLDEDNKPKSTPTVTQPKPTEVKKEVKPEEDQEEEEEDFTQDQEGQQTGQDVEDQGDSKKNKPVNLNDLRSPICCVLGHVDVGKTKILDKIRSTNVQGGEAGGITQQIGATYVPIDAIKKQTFKLNEMVKKQLQYNLPGLLIIDTPGHESFNNLRKRGTSLCDIAILVVDLMHGLERQTLEALQIIRNRRTPFIVAINKVDALYEWKSTPNAPIRESLKNQKKNVMQQFETKVKDVVTQFQQQGLNAELYYKNKDVKNIINLVPTSALTGEGIPDLLALMCQLTQKHMVKKLTYKSEIECTILEVKVVEGHGTTIDVVLSNGILKESDTIVVCGLGGPIVTQIRALLTPKPLREIRVKGEYIHQKEVRASMGIKISAQDLEGAVPGSNVLVVKPGDDVEKMKKEVMADLNEVLNKISTTDKGVFVQASTLGSLEALLDFLKSEEIPVSGINIGPVHRKDVIRSSIMLEHAPEFAVILAFDVKVTNDAAEEAKKVGVTIFSADIIYHLFDRFKEYKQKILEEKKAKAESEVVWPCTIKILPDHVFHKYDPITVGVEITDGVLKVGTPLVVPGKEPVHIGKVISIQYNKNPVKEAEKGKQVSISIENGKNIQYGKQFDLNSPICSRMTRRSIDLLKELYPEIKENANIISTIVKLKQVLNIP
ncbi:hypothetical protein ABK040_006123 [Willaertia magna]